MRSALIATFIVTAGILLLMGILLFGRTTASRSDTNEVAGEKRELQQGAVAELAGDFEYLENCAKYVMKDFQTRDIFEKNKDVMPQNALSSDRRRQETGETSQATGRVGSTGRLYPGVGRQPQQRVGAAFRPK